MFVITDDASYEDSAALHHAKVVQASAKHDDGSVDPLPLEQTVKRQKSGDRSPRCLPGRRPPGSLPRVRP